MKICPVEYRFLLSNCKVEKYIGRYYTDVHMCYLHLLNCAGIVSAIS